MRAWPPTRVFAASVVMLVLTAACEAKVDGKPETGPRSPSTRAIVAPELARTTSIPALHGLPARVSRATDEAAAEGATISVGVLDRTTGQMISNGNAESIATASVAKLFIADELLFRTARRKTVLSPRDRTLLDAMLRSSDDRAAEQFWTQGGGDAIISAVASRYGLASTLPPPDGRWWNTISTTTDLIRYYDMLLEGSGGLPSQQMKIIVDDLARSTPAGVDGYPQRFGIPDGLYGEPVAVKQGWMCCLGSEWMHLSTGVIGPDRRYIAVIESRQAGDDATARATITRAVRTMFPTGRI